MAATRERHPAHDPGRVLGDLVAMLADGGDCVTDMEALRGQQALFGAVASETTARRVLKSIDALLLDRLRAARAVARERAWDAARAPATISLEVRIRFRQVAPLWCAGASARVPVHDHGVLGALLDGVVVLGVLGGVSLAGGVHLSASGGRRAWVLERRHLWECAACHQQTSVTARTGMHGTRTPLRTWFWGGLPGGHPPSRDLGQAARAPARALPL